MHFIKNSILLLGAILPLIAAVPVPDAAAAPVRKIPGKYIVKFREGTDVQAHTSWVAGVHKRNLAKRDANAEGEAPAGIQKVYRAFTGYSGSFDDATIKEIEASEDVRFSSLEFTHRPKLLTGQ